MRKSTRKALALLEHRLGIRVVALRGRVDHLETVNEGLRYELETERRERIRQIDFVTQILGPLVADLEHRAEQPGADPETVADYKEIVESTEAEEDRTFPREPAPDSGAPFIRHVPPRTLVQEFYEGLS